MVLRIFYLVLVLLLAISCNEEEIKPIETDPKKAILGKWEAFGTGNWPQITYVDKSLGYIRFYEDSILKEYDYEKQEYVNQIKYYIDDSLIYFNYSYENGELSIPRKYEFLSKNQILRLDYIDMFGSYNTSVYKRIN